MSVVRSLHKACFCFSLSEACCLPSYLLECRTAGRSALSLVLVPDFTEMASSN